MTRPILRLNKPSRRAGAEMPEKLDETGKNQCESRTSGRRRPSGVECLALLAKEYPDLFRPDNPKPLKLGIHADMRSDCGLSGAKIRRGLREWTRHVNYLSTLAEGGPRYGIDGKPCGEISEAAIEGAREKLGALDAAESGG